MANPNPSPETRFKPGWEGGPGRPRKLPITDHLIELLAEETEEGTPYSRAIAKSLRERAIGGSIQHIREILDRVEGKVAQPVEVSDHKVTHELVWPDANPDAAPAPGAAGGEDAPGEVQDPGMRPALGQDEAGVGPVP